MIRRLNWIRIVGFVVAVGLVVFGTVGNLWRTIRYGLEKEGKNNY